MSKIIKTAILGVSLMTTQAKEKDIKITESAVSQIKNQTQQIIETKENNCPIKYNGKCLSFEEFNKVVGEKKVEKTEKPKTTKKPKETVNKNNGVLVFSNATITTYNPVSGQTDDTPCINHATEGKLKKIFGTGDLCKLQKMGVNTVAVTQDRLEYVYKVLGKKVPKGKVLFEPGDKIKISGAGQCNGIYYVADALNKRYNGNQHIDIFKNSKKHNTKCTGAKVTLIEKASENIEVAQK